MISFCISLSREVIKGVMDVEGDRKHGILTLAVRYGVNAARNTGVVLQSLVIILAASIFMDNGLIGRIGLSIFILYFIYTLSITVRALTFEMAKKSKTLGLFAPLLVLPFLVLDQIFKF
jgi:geranylgeranylglycerol-phosphate geranylgeranyltransferase